LVLGFLNRYELAEFSGLGVLALPDRFGMGLKDAEDLIGNVRVAEDARPRLGHHLHDNRPQLLQPLLDAAHPSRRRIGCRARPLNQPTNHGARFIDDGARRAQQAAIAPNQLEAGGLPLAATASESR
jgi:hypothetical protein